MLLQAMILGEGVQLCLELNGFWEVLRVLPGKLIIEKGDVQLELLGIWSVRFKL